jgi:small subunit ribosomal protein S8
MSFTDPIADALTRIRNGQHKRFETVKVRNSNQVRAVLSVLKNQGYIKGFTEGEAAKGLFEITVELKYADGRPVIELIKRISTPGRRLYSGIADLGKVRNGLGITILSTSKGIMTDADARRMNVGGELLCQVV